MDPKALAFRRGEEDAQEKYKVQLRKKGAPLVRGRDAVGWKEKSVSPAKLGGGTSSV